MNEMMMKGMILNIMRYSIHDGPGIRTTVFMKGCPLSCKWCHNPEALSSQLELIHRKERCIRCGNCVTTCPQKEDAVSRIADELRRFGLTVTIGG